jgi:hypothetical protein
MAFDINQLTIGEIQTAERLGQSSVSVLNDPEQPKAGMLMGLAYVITKRTDPTFTIAQASALTLSECSSLISADDDDDEDDAPKENANESTPNN